MKRGERVKPPSLSGSMSGAGDGSKKSVAGKGIGSSEKTIRPKSFPIFALHLGQMSDMLCLHGTQPDRLNRRSDEMRRVVGRGRDGRRELVWAFPRVDALTEFRSAFSKDIRTS